jgi:hypothetical protein
MRYFLIPIILLLALLLPSSVFAEVLTGHIYFNEHAVHTFTPPQYPKIDSQLGEKSDVVPGPADEQPQENSLDSCIGQCKDAVCIGKCTTSTARPLPDIDIDTRTPFQVP